MLTASRSFIPIGLGPAFLTASIYLTLARVVCTYSPSLSLIRPRTYTLAFVCIDIISLAIQAVGGSLAASARADGPRNRATDVLIAGLALQAAGLAVFISLGADYLLRVRKAEPEQLLPQFAELRASVRFRAFLIAVSVAALAIFVRCIYRVVELCEGFTGNLANEEVPFIILEGPPVMLAVVLMTLWHPGWVYGAAWADADWSFRRDGRAQGQMLEVLKESVSDGDVSSEETSRMDWNKAPGLA